LIRPMYTRNTPGSQKGARLAQAQPSGRRV
jgi:hypothetical protein